MIQEFGTAVYRYAYAKNRPYVARSTVFFSKRMPLILSSCLEVAALGCTCRQCRLVVIVRSTFC